jgi:hypothetical protein
MVTDLCCPPKLWVAGRSAIPKQVIDEHGTVRDEAVITDRHEIADERMRLNAATFPDLCSSLDLYKRPHKRIVTDLAAIKVRWLDNDHVIAKPNIHQTNSSELNFVHTAIANG